jgi:hypothetical protein
VIRSLAGRWLIVILTGAWLIWEIFASADGDPNTWPLTKVLVTYLPIWLYMPAALLLAVWLPWHLWSNRRNAAQGGSPMKYAKALVAVAIAALTAAQTALPLNDQQHTWVTVVLAVLGAVAVYAVPNKQPDPSAVRTLPTPPAGYPGSVSR